MNLWKSALRALATGTLGLSLVCASHATELKENTARIDQDIKIPGMAVTIKRPGNETGCNAANHEKWDSDKGGCSNTEYMKENAKVITVDTNDPRLSIGVLESTTLTANVRTQDGQFVGAGVPVTWTTTKGSLSTYSSITNAASQATVTLTTPKGTETGMLTVTGSAKGGGAISMIAVGNSATVSELTASPPVALADGSSFITLVATLSYYENKKSVGPGESLTWGTEIGKFTYAENVTNPEGKSVAYLVSTEPGTKFVSATKDVPVLQQVTFTSPGPVAPVITSFTMRGRYLDYKDKGWTENVLELDYDVQWYRDNEFKWESEGADRFELVDEWGDIVYAGAEPYVRFHMMPIAPPSSNPRGNSNLYMTPSAHRDRPTTYTLRAYKGSSMSTKTLTVMAHWYMCGGGCSM